MITTPVICWYDFVSEIFFRIDIVYCKSLKNNNFSIMIDQNAPTAKYYDKAYGFKYRDHLPKELKFIKKYLKQNSKILDIGCGTGRHAISIFEEGFDISGFDISKAMLTELSKKNPNIEVILGNFLDFDFEGKKFDVLLCFWNSIAEIAKDIDALHKFFAQSRDILNNNGKLILNFDDATNLDPNNFSYTDSFFDGENKVKISWIVDSYNPNTKTTQTYEKIEITNIDTNITKSVDSQITQKWWTKEEITKISGSYNFVFQDHKLYGSDECYLVIESS